MKKSDQWIARDPAEFTPSAPPPYDPLDHLSPQELFDRGVVTPDRYLYWQTPDTRELVRWVMHNHPRSTLAKVLDELWWFGGL